MTHLFYDFWRMYEPLPEYRNRYQACEKLWNDMDELHRHRILYQLQTEQSSSGEHIPLAVALDSKTQTYKICTRADAEAYGLTIHHFM